MKLRSKEERARLSQQQMLESLGDRGFLQTLREAAFEKAGYLSTYRSEAYKNLAKAADYIDAALARTEVNEDDP